MNILRLSTLSLIFAIAVMTLGYVNSSSAAPKDCVENDPRGKCNPKPGDDGPATTFSVEMRPGDVDGADGLVTSDGACGTTEGTCAGSSCKDLDVTIPNRCVTVEDVCFITGPTGCPVTLRAFALLVRANKSDMVIFFTDGEIEGTNNTGDVYVSDRLPVTISRSNDGSITVEVNESDQNLTKANGQGKETLLGPIAIGVIVYTPD
jgi:hypothetical protein